MVTTTAGHPSDRSRARACVFDPDSGNWYVPEVYTPTDVSLGNVPGYDNYIAPEPKGIVDPGRSPKDEEQDSRVQVRSAKLY